MSVLHEIRIESLSFDIPEQRSRYKFLLPPGASFPWQAENANLRLYQFSYKDEKSLALKVKLSTDPASDRSHGHEVGYAKSWSKAICKVTMASATRVHLDFEMHDARDCRLLHLEFHERCHALSFVDLLRSTVVGPSNVCMLQDGAVLIDEYQGGRSKFCKTSRSWKRCQENHEGDRNGTNLSASSSSSTSSACSRAVCGDAEITERWPKAPRTGRYEYNDYMSFEKERLVDLLIAKDEELSRMKGLLANIHDLSAERSL
eukprot:gnl/MRDRNA2_/MRDRNA2_61261_c0_seq1.p1 gnl/MRDRNA2_/MRDRNA2_61261_c0~~gnl/MRDRNA2_/MRDRNA2_61261_c0_seq1.p1  ORF type:complete len:260 (+),score=45.13 gnl/MRDRNA2_/MRDRNA2_61261_c0_seq1:99-878(+)